MKKLLTIILTSLCVFGIISPSWSMDSATPLEGADLNSKKHTPTSNQKTQGATSDGEEPPETY